MGIDGSRGRTTRLGRALIAVGALALTLLACLPAAPALGAADRAGRTGRSAATPVTVRLGFFPNVTHAPALVGVDQGIFARHLGRSGLRTMTFNAGPDEVMALLSGALDMGYLGPSPTVNGYVVSDGEAIRVVSGAVSGGAFLVVAPGIATATDLKGTTIASPQLGNTQDVALRTWLRHRGLKTDTLGGGDVSIIPQDNATTLAAFQQHRIEGAWVPEPWATRLVEEGGGRILVDERDLWPEGRYVTTNLVVRTEFLRRHPGAVKRVIRANLESIDSIEADRDAAEASVTRQIGKITGKPIPPALVTAAFTNLEFTPDPLAASLRASARESAALGFIDPPERLSRIFDLALLDQVLAHDGRPAIPAP